MEGVKKGLFWSGFSQVGQTGIQLISTIILARLLTPEDYGIMAMVAIFVAIANIMVDSGLGGALLKMYNPDNTDFSTLFLYNLATSIFLYLLFFFFAPIIAEFYEKPILTNILRVLMISIIIYAISIVQFIKLLRALKFKTLAIIISLSSLMSLIIAALLAFNNYGIWALVFQQISYAFFYSVLLWIVVRFIPTMTFSIRSFREQSSFGISLLLANLLNSFTDNINNNVIAKLVPVNQAGYFSQSNRLVLSLDGGLKGVLDKVLFPVFAKIHNKEEMKERYIELTKKVISLVFPIIALFALFSEQIILLLLGEKWKDAAWMFRVLSFALLPMIVQTLSRNILKSIGLTKYILINETVKSACILIILFITSFWGIKYIVWGVVLAQTISCIFIMLFLSKGLNYPIFYHIRLILSYTLPTMLSYFAALIINQYFLLTQIYINTFINLLVFVVFLMFFTLCFKQKELLKILFKKVK